MKMTALLVPLGLLTAAPMLGATAQAKDAPAKEQKASASIPFADHGGVEDWRGDGTRAVYFKDSHNQWYRAELMGVATDLPFVQRIGIDAGPSGTLDRFGAITVEGRRFTFTSFTKVDGPPSKHAAKTPHSAKAK